MEIRKKLTYQFIGLVAIILLFSSITIYLSFSKSRKEEFYDRLSSKAKLVAQMLVEIDEIDKALLRKIERNNPLSLPNEKIIIYGYNNNEIYSSDDDDLLHFTTSQINDVRLKESIRLKQGEYEIFGLFYTNEFDRIVVFTAATDIFGMNKLEWLRIILIIVFIISLIIVFLTGKVFASRALMPMSKIIEQVDNIGVTNLNDRVDEGNGQDEIAKLAQTFNKMLERIEAAFEIQKNFIANASHELRTPLTVLTGQLEVIQLKSRTSNEYRETLNLVLDEIKNLNNISNKMLLLAQASSDYTRVNFSVFRVDDLLWQACNELQNLHKDYTLNVSFDEKIDSAEKLIVFGNDLLLKTAIANLAENACKFSANKTSNIFLSSKNSTVSLRFLDNGPGISAAEQKMIFQPFYRSKKVINTKGHGIGLSLVEKIIQLHNGKIEVFSELNKGSEFTITLPNSMSFS